MARFSGKQLNLIKEKMNVDRIWSFSKMSTSQQCSWLYNLKYIKRMKGIQDSCYTYWGSISHEIIQDYYDGKYSNREEMVAKLEEEIVKYNTENKSHLKFPNENESVGYFNNLRHYFANTELIQSDVRNEMPVIIKLEGKEKYVFQGFIDSIYTDENGKTVILDYKTSSDSGFTGKSLLKKAMQLMLYTNGLVQFQKYNIDDIIIRYDMMKYVNIEYKQKNGTWKQTRKPRSNYVSFLYSKLLSAFKNHNAQSESLEKSIKQLNKKRSAKCRTQGEIVELSEDIDKLEDELENLKVFDVLEIDSYIEYAIENNTLNELPYEIKSQFKVNNAYIDVPVDKVILKQFMNDIVEVLDSVVERESMEDVDNAFSRGDIQESESYFCKNLCDMRNNCKYFEEYRENVNLYKTEEDGTSDDDILKMLGL